jgi:hypothetical protein
MERPESLPIIVEDDEFLVLLTEETARAKRYGHPFAVLMLQPPAAADPAVTLAVSALVVITSGVVRECDTLCVLETQGTVAMLLPETDVCGAGALLERLRRTMGDDNHEWHVELFAYPENEDKIFALTRRAA